MVDFMFFYFFVIPVTLLVTLHFKKILSSVLLRAAGSNRIHDVRYRLATKLLYHCILRRAEHTLQLVLDTLADWAPFIRLASRHGKGILLFNCIVYFGQ